jgi:hypothetical protein
MRSLTKLRPRSAYDVMAAVAFFVAIAGGGAYAAATIGPNDIKSDAIRSLHIKDGEVHRADLAFGAVGTRRVIDGSLLRQDINPAQLPPGAYPIQVIVPVGPGVYTAPRAGIKLLLDCDLGSPGAPSVSFLPSNGGDMDVVGTYAINGSLSTVHASGLHIGSNSGKPIDLDVIARTRPRPWANFALRADYDPSAQTCRYLGMVLPARGP